MSLPIRQCDSVELLSPEFMRAHKFIHGQTGVLLIDNVGTIDFICSVYSDQITVIVAGDEPCIGLKAAMKAIEVDISFVNPTTPQSIRYWIIYDKQPGWHDGASITPGTQLPTFEVLFFSRGPLYSTLEHLDIAGARDRFEVLFDSGVINTVNIPPPVDVPTTTSRFSAHHLIMCDLLVELDAVMTSTPHIRKGSVFFVAIGDNPLGAGTLGVVDHRAWFKDSTNGV